MDSLARNEFKRYAFGFAADALVLDTHTGERLGGEASLVLECRFQHRVSGERSDSIEAFGYRIVEPLQRDISIVRILGCWWVISEMNVMNGNV